MSNFNIKLLVWVAVIGIVFAIVWKQGYLTRISTYVQETRDELKKCAWPTRAELVQSTLLILTTVALMGAFTVCVDFVILQLVKQLHPH